MKRAKTISAVAGGSTAKKKTNRVVEAGGLVLEFAQRRLGAAADVRAFPFNKKRVRVISEATVVKERCPGGVVYWMYRDARVQDNWALLYAQRLALKLELPLAVVYCLEPKYLCATLRQYKFAIGGLQSVEQELGQLNIQFQLLIGSASTQLSTFVRQHDIGAIVCDMMPLRLPRQWLEDLRQALPNDVPLTQVDAHNIVPVWLADNKRNYSAATLRPRINKQLAEFLTEFPPLVRHPNYKSQIQQTSTNWQQALESLECDTSVDAVMAVQPGYEAACQQLSNFCANGLRIYNDKRNDPNEQAVSGLSPWFHAGQIAVQRCILEVQRHKSMYKPGVEAFSEEAIIRRELSDNFCFYEPSYDSLSCCYDWAKNTLDAHRKDKREPCYGLETLESARTYDDLWNAAQMQLLREGRMHGFLRMYWAKKLLEWTEAPERALEYAIQLNDKYALDGLDPNGYVGCLWSIGGIHDHGWGERAIFGKIRYMNYAGCKRKFDVAEFVRRYGAKTYK